MAFQDLSGNELCDPLIICELSESNIPVYRVNKRETDVPYTVVGGLGCALSVEDWSTLIDLKLHEFELLKKNCSFLIEREALCYIVHGYMTIDFFEEMSGQYDCLERCDHLILGQKTISKFSIINPDSLDCFVEFVRIRGFIK